MGDGSWENGGIVLLMVSGLDVDRGVKAKLVNKYVESRKVTWEGEMVQVSRTG